MKEDNILEKFSKKELLEEAECLEQCGEYLHMSLMGYRPETLRKYAKENK